MRFPKSQAGVNILMISLYCSEGNNVPEGSQMADKLQSILTIDEEKKDVAWHAPPSWSILFQPPPVDQMLFM